MKVAIVGAGVSGLVVAYLLGTEHHVTVFDANSHAGGHVNTIRVEEDDRTVGVDTGFVVFNEHNYPSFTRLLSRLNVASQPSDMSFSVHSTGSGFEYSGDSLRGLFADRRNLWKPEFYRQFLDIARFQRDIQTVIARGDDSETLGTYLKRRNYSRGFVDRLLVPMGSALWSTDPARILDFPVAHFMRFFHNHRLLERRRSPQWRVIEGGASTYVERLVQPFRDNLRLRTRVQRIERRADSVCLSVEGAGEEHYDHVVLATHSDQALRLLSDPSDDERRLLSAFPYQRNPTLLHDDTRVMPRREAAWASWNYHLGTATGEPCRVTYWMNRLQQIDSSRNYCVTLNRVEDVAPERVIEAFDYEHPTHTTEGVVAQRHHDRLIGHNRTSYCGAYWGYGFHEDGVRSALAVTQSFGISLS